MLTSSRMSRAQSDVDVGRWPRQNSVATGTSASSRHTSAVTMAASPHPTSPTDAHPSRSTIAVAHAPITTYTLTPAVAIAPP
jgi:hypothetical protein